MAIVLGLRKLGTWGLTVALGLTGLISNQGAWAQTAQGPGDSQTPHRSVITKYCAGCHNDKLRTASLALDRENVDEPSASPAVWEKVIRKLKAGQMPPVGMPRPDASVTSTLVAYLEESLDRMPTGNPKPQSITAHRLNRAEYTNAIRDLLHMEIDGSELLPADDSGGFDNFADLLTVSPLLMEKYLAAARRISRLAVGSPEIQPDSQTYEVSPLLLQADRMSESMPFGTRGGIAIDHIFPVDGEYVVKVRLLRVGQTSYVIGMAEPHLLDVRLDGKRVKLFTVGGQHKGLSPGQQGADAMPPNIEEAVYERTADAHLEVRFEAQAGRRRLQIGFLEETFADETEFLENSRKRFILEEYERVSSKPGVSNITVSGPFNPRGPGSTASRERIFLCHPAAASEEESCARSILEILARRAYRRPVTDADVAPLLGLYSAGRAERNFESGVERALQGLLVSPNFLFRVERGRTTSSAGTATAVGDNRISEVELASRLSFFLWSSIPDDELLAAAERGTLGDSEVLRGQISRMLADPRSQSLVDNFAGQWLFLRDLKNVTPNRDIFIDFDDNLRSAFQQETTMLLASNLREDRPVLDLMTADYTFVNERLARHYGIAGIRGTRFRRVAIADENRRGLLGHGSVLTVSSLANRTSPVIRGKWVLQNLLGAPPPPPPPNVPALKEKGAGGNDLSMRQQMEQHRANPVCANCHRLMDPIGFALENFDAIGKWRGEDAGAPIDASGTLPDGTQFVGPAELRQALLRRPELFVQTVTEKLYMYAMGRGIEYYDMAAIRGVLRGAAGQDHRWSAIIAQIVQSEPFQARR